MLVQQQFMLPFFFLFYRYVAINEKVQIGWNLLLRVSNLVCLTSVIKIPWGDF